MKTVDTGTKKKAKLSEPGLGFYICWRYCLLTVIDNSCMVYFYHINCYSPGSVSLIKREINQDSSNFNKVFIRNLTKKIINSPVVCKSVCNVECVHGVVNANQRVDEGGAGLNNLGPVAPR